MVSIPALYSDSISLDEIGEKVSQKCTESLSAGSGVRAMSCVVKLVKDPSLIENVLKMFPPRTLQFFYSDFYLGYNDYKYTLNQIFSLIRLGGVMMGSRYVSYHTQEVSLFNILSAVDDFSTMLSVPHAVLATFAESSYR